MGLCVDRREKQDQKEGCQGPPAADYRMVEFGEIRQETPVFVLFDLFIEEKQQSGQYQHYCGDAQHHALGHDYADIPP